MVILPVQPHVMEVLKLELGHVKMGKYVKGQAQRQEIVTQALVKLVS